MSRAFWKFSAVNCAIFVDAPLQDCSYFQCGLLRVCSRRLASGLDISLHYFQLSSSQLLCASSLLGFYMPFSFREPFRRAAIYKFLSTQIWIAGRGTCYKTNNLIREWSCNVLLEKKVLWFYWDEWIFIYQNFCQIATETGLAIC